MSKVPSHIEGAKPYQRCQARSKVPSHVEAYLQLGSHVEGDQSLLERSQLLSPGGTLAELHQLIDLRSKT
jgi:hypothetical protein